MPEASENINPNNKYVVVSPTNFPIKKKKKVIKIIKMPIMK